MSLRFVQNKFDLPPPAHVRRGKRNPLSSTTHPRLSHSQRRSAVLPASPLPPLKSERNPLPFAENSTSRRSEPAFLHPHPPPSR
ncbi:hypothetical protein TNCV_5112031 [Trichonephila clavipes]|nr:hypothetical protein TNCV_5112031 [Trichonephila clavipes]